MSYEYTLPQVACCIINQYYGGIFNIKATFVCLIRGSSIFQPSCLPLLRFLQNSPTLTFTLAQYLRTGVQLSSHHVVLLTSYCCSPGFGYYTVCGTLQVARDRYVYLPMKTRIVPRFLGSVVWFFLGSCQRT